MLLKYFIYIIIYVGTNNKVNGNPSVTLVLPHGVRSGRRSVIVALPEIIY